MPYCEFVIKFRNHSILEFGYKKYSLACSMGPSCLGFPNSGGFQFAAFIAQLAAQLQNPLSTRESTYKTLVSGSCNSKRLNIFSMNSCAIYWVSSSSHGRPQGSLT